MAEMEVGNFDSPDETRPFEGKGQVEIVRIAGPIISATWSPGAAW